jgi:hypothetical protein
MINRGQNVINFLVLDIGCLIISFVTAFWIRFGMNFNSTYKISYGFILILTYFYVCMHPYNKRFLFMVFPSVASLMS